MYRNMVEQLVMHAVSNNIVGFTRLKALKYNEIRNLYPQLQSHYVYIACQDASARAKSILRMKMQGLTRREYPEVRSITIWLREGQELLLQNGLLSLYIIPLHYPLIGIADAAGA